MDKEIEDSIIGAVTPVIVSLTAGLVVAGVSSIIESLLVTNYSQSTPAGETEMHPTENETALSKSEVSGTETEGALSQDSVKVNEGEIDGNTTNAQASNGSLTAANNGAYAVKTDTASSDIETAALKMT